MKKVLILEDDTRIAAALAIRLSAAGYDVSTASDGLQGIHQVVEERPDLLVMDIWMPVGLGFSVAQRMQGLGLKGIPIIFITAHGDAKMRIQAMRDGAVEFLTKPFDNAVLLETVHAAVDDHAKTLRLWNSK